jgi:hypothetical protein
MATVLEDSAELMKEQSWLILIPAVGLVCWTVWRKVQ